MKKRTKNIIVASVLIIAIAVSGAYAYLTARDEATNTFTMGEVKIDLREPEYDPKDPDATPNAADNNANGIPDAGEYLSANQIVNKNPYVENIGTNDAYVYISVQIPKENVKVADTNGTVPSEPSNTQMFEMLNLDTTNWTLVSSKTATPKYNVYLYAYNTAVAPERTTEPLFTQIQLVNLVDGELDFGTTEEVIVNAYAIQTNFGDNQEKYDTPVKAWNIYKGSHGIVSVEGKDVTTKEKWKTATGTWDLDLAITAIRADGTRERLDKSQFIVEPISFEDYDDKEECVFEVWVYDDFTDYMFTV